MSETGAKLDDSREAIVTGAAHGIGRAIATHLATAGIAVAMVDRLGQGARDAAASVPGAIGIEADVSLCAGSDRHRG